MSWPSWHSTAPPMPGVVPTASTVMPSVVNAAPALLPPPATATAPGGMQYTPEQWAQVQQQNWQQWAQWQQQYQQWHQQYGAEYQKSMSALSTPTANTAAPPPPPNENKPPPPPPEDNLKAAQYGAIQSGGYSTVPPPTQQYLCAPPPVAQYTDQSQGNWQNSSIKRTLPQAEDFESNKRQMVDNQNLQWNKQNPPPPKPGNSWQSQNQPPPKSGNSWQSQPPPSAQSQAQKVLNLEELTEAEKKFDKEFAAWEAQFNKWKDQNANHPDKTQYLEYEKKWESWRNSLLDRREQMRKKRMALQASMLTSAPKVPAVSPQQSFKQPPPLQQPPPIQQPPPLQQPPLLQQPPPPIQQLPPLQHPPPIQQIQKDSLPKDIFSKPPPTQNNEPLSFKQSVHGLIENAQEEKPDVASNFLRSSAPTSGGIPGLDLVKEGTGQDDNFGDEPAESNESEKVTPSKGPDLDAISKGINTILGDPKLLNMLSMVSQNQNFSTGISVDVRPKITQPPPPPRPKAGPPIPSLLDLPMQRPSQEKSEHNYDDYSDRYNSNQVEMVNNFDDQTRMSFSNGPNDQDLAYISNSNSNIRPEKTNNFHRFAGGDNRPFGGGNAYNDYKFGRNNSFDGPPDVRQSLNEPDSFRGMNGSSFNRDQRYNDNYRGSDQNYRGSDQNYHGSDHQYRDEPNEEQWNEEDEYEKYHNMFNEGDHSQEDLPDNHPHPNMGMHEPVPLEIQEEPAVDDGPLFVPEKVVDYEHKSLHVPEPEVSLEMNRMFDYRHKQVNRIPYPQRPVWLSSTLRNIRQFDPLGMGRFSGNDILPPSRYAPERPERIEPFERRGNFEDRDPGGDRRFSRERYPESRGGDWREKENATHDFSPKRSRDPNYRQAGGEISRIRHPEGTDDRVKPFEKKLDLEELSDDEWEDEKNVSNNETLKFSPPSRNMETASPDLTSDLNPSNPTSATIFNQNVVLEDLINPPGRYNRPPRIVIILRGPPGSGKTYLAKLIKDREVENGGSAPRILSLDDYFMVEYEKEVMEDGKTMHVKEMSYEYEAGMEESYRQSLIKSFKKTITDGYFHFVVVDNVNQKVKNFGEMWSFAKQNGFQVYICQLDLDPEVCTSRNIHQRSQSDIEDCIAGWEPTPSHHPLVDPTSFLQSVGPITEVEMEEAEPHQDQTEVVEEEHVRSKWDTFDCSLNNLARLDGLSKPLRPSSTMEEYLQLDNEWEEPSVSTKPGQKRVRWADLEEQKHQKKMKAIGFVIGQTDWKRITDTSNGETALTQTKYIERRRFR